MADQVPPAKIMVAVGAPMYSAFADMVRPALQVNVDALLVLTEVLFRKVTIPLAVRLEVKVTVPAALKVMLFQLMPLGPLVLRVAAPVMVSVELIVVIVPDDQVMAPVPLYITNPDTIEEPAKVRGLYRA